MPLPGSSAAQTVCLITTTLEQRDLMRQINVAMLAPPFLGLSGAGGRENGASGEGFEEAREPSWWLIRLFS